MLEAPFIPARYHKYGPLPKSSNIHHGYEEKIRCRKIDLGKWAMGVYKISSPVLDPEVLEDLGEAGSDRGDSYDE
jgi:hypothetical protein